MDPIVLAPGEGRDYDLGRITATFKAEVAGCSISEWWMEPSTAGPGTHQHPEDDVFYVLGGTLHVRVGEEWHEAATGAYVHVPGGTPHDFENRSADHRAGFLNVSVPGGFEPAMPGIAAWFRERDGFPPA